MNITPQQQRIPLVDLNTGLIRREWLTVLGSTPEQTSTQVTALETALAAALARISALEAEVSALSDSVSNIPVQDEQIIVQPAPGPQGAQGEQGPQGKEGYSTFPKPFEPIPLNWPEELRTALELSGQY